MNSHHTLLCFDIFSSISSSRLCQCPQDTGLGKAWTIGCQYKMISYRSEWIHCKRALMRKLQGCTWKWKVWWESQPHPSEEKIIHAPSHRLLKASWSLRVTLSIYNEAWKDHDKRKLTNHFLDWTIRATSKLRQLDRCSDTMLRLWIELPSSTKD